MCLLSLAWLDKASCLKEHQSLAGHLTSHSVLALPSGSWPNRVVFPPWSPGFGCSMPGTALLLGPCCALPPPSFA